MPHRTYGQTRTQSHCIKFTFTELDGYELYILRMRIHILKIVILKMYRVRT